MKVNDYTFWEAPQPPQDPTLKTTEIKYVSCPSWSFIWKAKTRSHTFFVSTNLMLLIYWALQAALGPRGAFHWSTWSPLIRQHFSPVIALELMSFQWATKTAAACVFVNVFIALSSFPCVFLTFYAKAAFDLDISEWRECAELNQLSSGFPKAPLIYLIIFQEVVLFFGVGVCVGGWGPLAHQLLSDCDCMMFELQWNSWLVRPRFSRASWTQGAGVWSLLFWQHFRLYLSPYPCVTMCSPHLLKVRGEQEVNMSNGL